jgi:polysaccharide export outer membrane protein
MQQMKNNHYFWNTFKLIVLIGIIGFTSCIPQKKLRYMQDLEESQYDTTSVSQNEKENSSYKIQSKDELYIMVNSLNPKTFVFFNGGENRVQYNQSDVSLYLTSYTVNDSGCVELPVVGQVFIRGLTVREASLEIEKALKKYLTEVSVTVKLSGFKVTLLGEVKRPGRYTAYVSQMNILEALALAGDMTPYGNRERVMLIREDGGKEQVYILNLLDKNLLNEDNFNLLPNDIIYVESLNAKTWGFETFPYALILSTLTTFIAMTTLILQIKN